MSLFSSPPHLSAHLYSTCLSPPLSHTQTASILLQHTLSVRHDLWLFSQAFDVLLFWAALGTRYRWVSAWIQYLNTARDHEKDVVTMVTTRLSFINYLITMVTAILPSRIYVVTVVSAISTFRMCVVTVVTMWYCNYSCHGYCWIASTCPFNDLLVFYCAILAIKLPPP